jgi:NAD(P)-dependent dehydrogenase (short-subunit alcohol dehydrogenase family)
LLPAAIAGLTRALVADHSPEGIRVNAVALLFVDGGMTAM